MKKIFQKFKMANFGKKKKNLKKEKRKKNFEKRNFEKKSNVFFKIGKQKFETD
jgi:hypothetical protein